MILRDETEADVEEIGAVTLAAFETLEISNQTEHFIIGALRDAGELAVSIVAVDEEGWIVGHIAFSRVEISDGTEGWYGLGPVSVLPELHGQGIGSSLVRKGLERVRKMGGKGCALVGNPNFYKRFGFRNYPGLVHEGVPQEFFLAVSFGEEVPEGKVIFSEAFLADS